MANDDARAHNPPSAMSPGTLMLGSKSQKGIQAMQYEEKYLTFRRTFILKDSVIVAKGEGWFNPNYQAEFSFSDLNPKPQRYKLPNRYRLMPMLVITPLLGFSMLLLGTWHESVGDIIPFINLVMLVICCLITLFVILHRQWWVQYINKSGIPCIGFLDRPKSVLYARFSETLLNGISDQLNNDAQQGDASEPGSNVDPALQRRLPRPGDQ